MKKIISTGLGAAILAKNKAQELIDDLVNKGKMTEEEGNKFLNDLKEETDKSKSDFENELRVMMRKILDRMNIASRQDIERLEKRIKILEQNEQENYRL
ncbi:MAG: phasin family protein [Candidatus Cyclobacteriaceae bacterium M3_2C_046]